MIVPLTPIRFLYRGVDLFGRKVGVVSGAKRFTYAEFGERCERLATGSASSRHSAGRPRGVPQLQQPSVAGRLLRRGDGAGDRDAAERAADAGGTDRHSESLRGARC